MRSNLDTQLLPSSNYQLNLHRIATPKEALSKFNLFNSVLAPYAIRKSCFFSGQLFTCSPLNTSSNILFALPETIQFYLFTFSTAYYFLDVVSYFDHFRQDKYQRQWRKKAERACM